MYVKSIKLINFRNYRGIKLDLSPKLNLFIGDNAQGKTNLLEAIYMTAMGKSYRTSNDKELIRFEKDKAYIGVEAETSRGSRFIEIKFQKDSKKRIRVNKLELEKVSELSGKFNIVIFAPEDLNLIKEGPSRRRAFLDTEISQIKPRYRYNLAKYNKILFQRNRLLKRSRYIEDITIDPWDRQLSDIGAEIVRERLLFVKKLSEISKDIHKKITGEIESLSIDYCSSIDISNIDDFSEIFYKQLKQNLEEDLEKGITTSGPHRDDIDIYINGTSCRSFGSQGQQRTAALSLKLAEVELINLEVGEYPILLLDDVLSELDSNRRKYLISTFKDVQTIITSTDDVDLLEGEEKKVFNIRNGNLLTNL